MGEKEEKVYVYARGLTLRTQTELTLKIETHVSDGSDLNIIGTLFPPKTSKKFLFS